MCFNCYRLFKVNVNTDYDELLDKIESILLAIIEDKIDVSKDVTKKFKSLFFEKTKSMIPEILQKINKQFTFLNFRDGFILSRNQKINLFPVNSEISNIIYVVLIELLKTEFELDLSKNKVIQKFIESLDVIVFYKPEFVRDNIYCLPIKDKLHKYSYHSLDSSDILLKDDFFIKNSKIDITSFESELILLEDETVGFSLDEYYWYFNINDIKKHILENDNLKWLMLSNYLTKKNKNSKTLEEKYSVAKSDFIEHIEEIDFTKLLSNLVKGFYIDQDLMPEKYKGFFEENQIFSDISKDKFKNKSFIVNCTENGTALGIHNDNNIGEKSDNLEYWISIEKDKVIHIPDNGEYKPKRIIAMTLKPEYSFYFMKCFSEDLIEETLKKLTDKGLIISYLRNYDFLKIDAEVDFFVYLKNSKIIKLEIKKTLSKFNIDIQKTKDEKYYTNDIYNIISNYFLIGFKGEESIINTYHYFIEQDPSDSNNIDFKIPLYNTKEKKELSCITANDYKNLSEILEKRFNEICAT